MDQASLTSFNQLLEVVYQGALDTGVWQEVPQHISAWMQAPQTTLFTPFNTPDAGGFMLAHNLSAQAIALWGVKYHGMDLWAQRAVERGLGITGAIFRDQDLATEDEFLATTMNREFFAPNDIGRVASGVVFGVDDPENMTVACSCNRPFARPFDLADLARLRLILPHLSRALGVMFRLRQAEFQLARGYAALDRLPSGVALIGKDGELLFSNVRAQAILDERDGLKLSRLPGHPGKEWLSAVQGAAQVKLTQAIAEVVAPPGVHAQHFSRALRVDRTSGLARYVLHFAPLPPCDLLGEGMGKPAAIVFINDGQGRIACDAQLLKAHFGATPAECRLMEHVANGASIDEMTVQLGVSVNTVKTHLRHAYEKTATKNRAQLIKLLLALCVDHKISDSRR